MDADTASAQPKVDAQQPAAENKETSAMETAPKTEQAVAESAAADAKPEADAAADSETKKPADGDDAEMKDAPAGAAETETTTVPLKAADDGEAAAPVTPAADKSKARRKSSGGTDTKKKLNRKGSKANLITHTDAKPGEYYFHQLKGHSPWPVVICDEEMLPEALLKTRPVSAARPDGTYREDHADGGKNVNGRKFPVMYLQTNEFGWALNTELRDLDPATVAEKVNAKMPKNLAFAHELAAEQHDLDHWKSELEDFAEKKRAMDEAAATSAKGSKKAKAFDPATDEEEEEDVEMADDADDAAAAKKSKKRKAEEAATPQRSDSVKKPKIKITSNSTPKTTNGATPKSSKPSESKTSKSKAKKDDKKSSKEQAPKEPELSPEERHQRKEKEVLFLRHKLQKGLLTRDQEPKEDEMKLMSDYITKLEGFQDLEVSIIRATKINKVLKGILKLSNIPKEAEFNFKTRSQALLDEWNKLLEGGDAAPAAGATNGVNGKSPAPSKAASPKEKTHAPNGVAKEDTPKEAAKSEEAKDAPKKDEAEAKADAKVDAPKETSEKPEAPADATAAAPEAVDAAA